MSIQLARLLSHSAETIAEQGRYAATEIMFVCQSLVSVREYAVKRTVVPLGLATPADEIVRGLERLIERVRQGEFETVVMVGFAPNGRYATKEFGRRHNRLEMIGILESIKTDILATTDTDEPAGF